MGKAHTEGVGIRAIAGRRARWPRLLPLGLLALSIGFVLGAPAPASAAANGSTTTVSSSVDPSVTGQAVSLQATVAPVAPATGTPTGTVTFSFAVSPRVTCAGGDAQLLVSGTATCDIGGLTAASDIGLPVTATYGGTRTSPVAGGPSSRRSTRARRP